MTENKTDPELVDDRDASEVDVDPIDLPDYDPNQFELPEDFEYTEDDDE